MPVPKRKQSSSRQGKRSANKGVEVKAVMQCQSCKAPIAPHQVCRECGYYKGEKVLRTKTDRMQERGSARQAQVEAAQNKKNQFESDEDSSE